MKLFYGPYTLTIDDSDQVVRVELKRRGSERWQLLSTEIEKLRAYVLARAAEFGWPVVEV